MKRILAAVVIVFAALALPAAAQTSAERQAVLEMQALLAEVGRWAQDHAAVMTRAATPLNDIEGYVGILDSFVAGEIEAETAIERIEAWRSSALASLSAGRLAAQALRAPPDLGLLGAAGARLDVALRTTHTAMLPTLTEMERVVNAIGDVGVAALRNPEALSSAKQRVLFEASIQLVRVDLARINVVAASLSDDHPNQALMHATRHYYATLIDVPQQAIYEVEGRADRAALVASLRANADSMRAELGRAEILSSQMIERMGAMQGGPAVEMARAVLQMAETFAPTIRAYRNLAANVDEMANALERGGDIVEVWADGADRDAPYLTEIERFEQERAALVANINRQPL